MIITCALSPFTSLPPSSVASPTGSAPSAGQSTVSSKSLREKINSEIDRLKELKKSFETKQPSQNNPLTEEENKRLSDCQSKWSALQTVHKLAEFAEQLDTTKSNTNNILTNLCTGLETFLGFDSTSKGYTGQGIVYSDLDRLADGVMGFLSGVLEGVKNAQTYNVGKDTLNSVSNEIKKHLCSGHDGFTKLLPSLTKQIEKYNREVRDSNEKVKKPIDDMIEYVKKSGKLCNGLNDLQVSMVAAKPEDEDPMVFNANALVAECKKYAEIFCTDMNSAHKNILDLNKNCNVNVNYALRNITRESAVLHRCSDKAKRDMKSMINEISAVLNNHRDNVRYEINDKVGQLIYELKLLVAKITEQLQNINEKMTVYVRELDKWMRNTETMIISAKRHVQKVINKEPGALNQDSIVRISKELNHWRDELERYINVTVKQTLNVLVRKALTKVHETDGKLKEDLYKVKHAVEGQVEEIKEAIGKLYQQFDAYGRGLQNKEEDKKKVEEVIKHFQIQVAGIRGNAKAFRGSADGLAAIRKYVWEKYAVKFAGSKFEDEIVKGWIADIWDNNGMVKKWIKGYVEGNKHQRITGSVTYFKAEHIDDQNNIIQKNHTQKIAGIIMAKLKDRISQATSQITAGEEQTIKMNLEYVRDMCTSFAQRIGEKIMESKFGSFASTIATAVDTTVRNADVTSNDVDRVCLTNAVHAILAALYAKARQAGDQINKLLNDCSFKNVDNAYKNASDLVDRLEKALGTKSPRSADEDGTAKAVDTAINKVKETLEAQLPNDPSTATATKVSLSHTNFGNYKRFVVQTEAAPESLKTELKGEEKEGALPAAIGDIGKYADKGFDVNATLSSLETWSNNLFSNIQNLLTAFSDTGKNINGYLNGLIHINLGHDLEKIRFNIDNLQRVNINDVIALADKFLHNDANELQSKYIMELQQFIDIHIDSALSTLTTLARKQYVSSVKHLLTAFAQKVTDELSPLPALIDKDRREGFKGFMRTLQGTINGNDTTEDNINLLKTIADAMNKADFDKEQTFIKLSYAFRNYYLKLNKYVAEEITRVHDENKAKKNPPGQDTEPYSSKLEEIMKAVDKLLGHIADEHRYDYKVPEMLEVLKKAITDLKPDNFDKPNTPMIDAMTDGLQEFIGELKRVYISAYDSGSFKSELVEYTGTEVVYTSGVHKIMKLTEEGRDCAKVCLSVIPILNAELTLLKTRLELDDTWHAHNIYNSSQPDQSLHKLFFGDNGYDFGLSHGAKNGELNHKEGYNGKCIFDILNNDEYQLFESSKQRLPLAGHSSGDSQEPEVEFAEIGIIPKLYSYLNDYFGVCHLRYSFSTRQPCNVYEMLLWLTGLPHNTIYGKLKQHIHTLFLVPREDDPSQKIYKPIDASYSTINDADIVAAIEHFCETSYAVLTSIVGTGDAATYYACEFANNSVGLTYPTRVADCLDMLQDILRRVFPALRYLQTKCRVSARHNGWRDCLYGRDIRTTKWPCNEHTKESTKKQTRESTNCIPKSPLQSYLSDCLPGHLPHTLTSIGCTAKCITCPNGTRGQPCLTPLGFRNYSGHTKVGADLYDVLCKFFENLNQTAIFCLSTKPPSTLPEHFGFALSLVDGWHAPRERGSKNVLQNIIENNISEVSMKLVEKRGPLTNALRLAYGSNQQSHFQHVDKSPDLCSLSMRTPCTNHPCSPYLLPSCADFYHYLAYENSNAYLSWAIYLPWTFWDLLNNLYNSFCSINCQDWGCRGCLRGDKCKKGQHGVVDTEKKSAICQCTSIVDCKGVAPTLYQYGFVFGEASTLNDKASPKKCSDFCSQLKNVLTSEYFVKLFKECDNFLYQIRFPFMSLTLALWLLSLLYLLHIMVIRLDLLHIKSHLHSPSSHRIAAQSLLAAARVNKLNRVFYLQP